jgi:hypothetical protein
MSAARRLLTDGPLFPLDVPRDCSMRAIPWSGKSHLRVWCWATGAAAITSPVIAGVLESTDWLRFGTKSRQLHLTPVAIL